MANSNPLPWSRVLHWIEFSEFLPHLPSGPRTLLSSSNLLIRRQDFLSGDGFCETFAMAEYLILSQKSRGKIHFVSETRILHEHRCNGASVRVHLRDLGYWSGRYRRSYRGSGSWLTRMQILSLGIPLYRIVRILRRIFQSDRREGLRALLFLPLLLLGLFSWSIGFYWGIRSSSLPPSARLRGKR